VSAAGASGAAGARRVTVRDVASRKAKGEKIVMVTAYDALFGRLMDESGVDLILVGDSLANVVAGLDSTVPVTLDQMIYHATLVCRGVKRAMVVVDMPFMTYQVSEERALTNAARVMQESSAHAVKLEGASDDVARAARRLVAAGVPVMAHLGFTPQSLHALGGFRVQGREPEAARALAEGARRMEDAGAFALVLELVPSTVAAEVTASLRIPTIGIGAGAQCDGQVLVTPDLLGLNDTFAPKFLKRYSSMADDVRAAVRAFGDDVRGGAYPAPEHGF